MFASLNSLEALERLIANPEVLAVSPNTRLTPASLTQSLTLIQHQPVRAMGLNGSGTTIAIIDSGLDWTEDAIFGSCPQGPGGVDCRVVLAMDIAPNDGVPDSSPTRHGTNVARIAAYTAVEANFIAYDISASDGPHTVYGLLAIDDLIGRTGTYNIVAANFTLTEGVFFSSQQDCVTVQTSDQNGVAYNEEFTDLVSAGIMPVVSSGNHGKFESLPLPACNPLALSVGAVYDASYTGPFNFSNALCSDANVVADQVGCYSNAAPFLSLLAPGGLIVGVLPSQEPLVGTSFSAPFAAGAVAIMRGSNAFPNDVPKCTRRRLEKVGVPVFDIKAGQSFPRLDLLASVNTPHFVGDCNNDLFVTVDELILGVNIANGLRNLSACPEFDENGSNTVSIDELISGVNSAASGGCAM